jgi:hypothetical protein
MFEYLTLTINQLLSLTEKLIKYIFNKKFLKLMMCLKIAPNKE